MNLTAEKTSVNPITNFIVHELKKAESMGNDI